MHACTLLPAADLLSRARQEHATERATGRHVGTIHALYTPSVLDKGIALPSCSEDDSNPEPGTLNMNLGPRPLCGIAYMMILVLPISII